MCIKRHSMACTVIRGQIYVFGGQRTKEKYLDSIERYDNMSDRWELLEIKLPKLVASLSGVTLGENRAVLTGGENQEENMRIPLIFETNDNGKMAIRQISKMNKYHFYHGSCLHESYLYVFGGNKECISERIKVEELE